MVEEAGIGPERRFLVPFQPWHPMILTCLKFSAGSLLIRLKMMVMANIYCVLTMCQGTEL